MKQELGIYIHIPFCIQKCYYCDFTSYTKQESMQEHYIEKILQELEQNRTKIEEREVTSIYLGGGTPSILKPKEIQKLLEGLKKVISWQRIKEVTIEVNPGTVDFNKLEIYQKNGVNRISIGLQATQNERLRQIGRIHTWEQFTKTYELTKKVGILNKNVDLMIGLPNQTIQEIKNSLEKIISLDPEHISVYSLVLEEGTKIENIITSGKMKLPTEELERQMYWYVKNTLELAGYYHYEISNFAKIGKESLHNVNCWNQKEYIGLGVAAHSYWKGKRYSNPDTLETYLNAIDFESIKQIHEEQTKEEQEKEYMLLGLRKIAGVSITEFKQKFGENPIYQFHKELDKLVKEKLVRIDLDQIKLTNKGLDLANIVWEEFI